jgi:hypothetical protein
MRFFRQSNGDNRASTPHPEEADVRKYRFILRTAPPDVQERVNQEALAALDGADRGAILAVLQRHAAVGERADPDNVPAMARLVRSSEARAAGVLLRNADPELMRRLARRALASPSASGLLAGYERWDGADPELEAEQEWKDSTYGRKFDAAMKQRRRDATGQGGIGM